MAGSLLRVVLCLALAAAVSCAGPLTLMQLPKNITVKVTTFSQQGQLTNAGTPCMTQELGSCPTVLQAAQDSLTASYAIAPAVKLPNFASVSVFACYSAASGYDRAWRKPNKNNLAKSQDCPFVIKKGLTATSGTVTWNIPDSVPDSTLYIRAYALCQKDPETTVRCAYGNSQGFFQVNKINDIPNGMKGAVAACCCISPIVVALVLFYESRTRKHH